MPRPRKFDEGDVVVAAQEQFRTRGYAATSVEDLTAATGLGKGSLYGAFGDKHDLFIRVLDEYISSSLGDVRRQLRDERYGAFDRLVRHLRAQVKALDGDRSRRGCMMAKSAAELGGSDEAVERAVERAYAAWRGELAAAIREAQRDGDIDPKRNPQALATTLLAFMRGQEALHKGGAKPTQLKAAAEEMIALIAHR